MSRVGGGPWSKKSKDQVPEENLKILQKIVSWDRHGAYSSEQAIRGCLTLRLTECTHNILYSEAICLVWTNLDYCNLNHKVTDLGIPGIYQSSFS